MFENHEIANATIEMHNKRFTDNIQDIFDGELYKKVMTEVDAFQSISLTFNCDGVPIFNSSSCSIWPILCTVNELPPYLRKRHVLLVSLWFGSSKPKIDNFFEPFVNEMIKLNNTGFTWKFIDRLITTKVRVLVGVCDSVARPLLQNCKQFNGKHGCGFCLDEGVRSGIGNSRVYPYKENVVLRTHKSTVEFSQMAFEQNDSVYGVKGPSILFLLPEFDVIDGMIPDYMHSVRLGVTRQLATLWFDTKNNQELYYLGGYVERVDQDLLSIKPPCNISRTPWSVGMRKFWKAHEWYAWLFYYSPIILKSYLLPQYYNHFVLLVEGVSILLYEQITHAMVDHAHRVFTQFVVEMEDLYELKNVSFNVHLCLHLSKSVIDWGPLWTHSAFVFEAYNAERNNMFKGTQAVPLQICKTFALNRSLPSLSRSFATTGSFEYNDLLKSLTPRTKQVEHALNVHGVTILGRPINRRLSTEHNVALHTVARVVQHDQVVRYFNRIVINGEIVHSLYYCRKLKRNSYVVELVDSGLFSIETFVMGDFNGDGDRCFAIGNFFTCIPTTLSRNAVQNISLGHIIAVDKQLRQLVAIEATRIKRKCVLINLPRFQTDFVCKQLNKIEYCS